MHLISRREDRLEGLKRNSYGKVFILQTQDALDEKGIR